MKTIPELLLKCCGRIRKPHSIKLLDDSIQITFYCPYCQKWLHLEIRNGMKKMLSNINLIKQETEHRLKILKNKEGEINE